MTDAGLYPTDPDSHTPLTLGMDVIEHAMRCTGDESLVLALRGTQACSTAALSVLGRLLNTGGVLSVSSPLVAWCSGTGVDETWRDRHLAADGSLWCELETLRGLYGPIAADDTYDELCLLRELSDNEFA